MTFEIDNIRDYLHLTLGVEVHFNLVEARLVERLPLYLSNTYVLYTTYIENQQIIFALTSQSDETSPLRFKKEGDTICKALGLPVVFSLPNIEAYRRQRMVQQKVSFVVPGKQLYIPFLAISFTETAGKKLSRKSDKFRPTTQLLFLYHLQISSLELISFNEIAHRIQYSNMSVGRAAEELQDLGLANITGKREKQLLFIERGRMLWDLATTYLQSPVKIDFYVDHPPKGIEGKKTGDNALAKYTNIAAGVQPELAIGPEEQKKLVAAVGTNGIDYFDGLFHIEVWNYPPDLLTNNDTVDPLSLFLSKKSMADERIQVELEYLINNIKW